MVSHVDSGSLSCLNGCRVLYVIEVECHEFTFSSL